MKDHPLPRRDARAATGPEWLLLATALGCLIAGCSKEKPAPPPPPVVQVEQVVATNVLMTTELIGQLDSPQNVEVRARVEGFVDKFFFTEGTEVKEGDPLFKLDDQPFQARLAAAKGALAEAKAALAKYEKDVARLAPLAQKKAVPQQDLDNAVASVDVGKANVLSAEANLLYAELNVTYCDIRSPITGLIGAKLVALGDLVGRGEPTLLATVSKLDPIWFYCNVSEVSFLRTQAEAKRTGFKLEDLPLTLLLSDGAVHEPKGKFVFIDRAVDVKTGTLRVRAEFPNTAKTLRPGMFARIRVDIGDRANSILVPERAITELQGKSFVWVVGADKKTSQRPVRVGGQFGEKLLVVEGLKPGELVVLEGVQKVREGGEVRTATAAELAQAAAQTTPTGQPAKE
jgi:membrane fusion protein (multidrug efflux system)